MRPTAGGARAPRLAALLAGLAVGATAWLSLGVLALVDPARMTRVGALPPHGWLGVLAVVGAALGAIFGGRIRLAPLALLVLPWLPWLPVPVPAAFLLWDGPLEGAVWTAALTGAAWPAVAQLALAHPLRDLWRSPRRAPWIAAVLAAVMTLTAWSVARPRVPAGDEPHYLIITQSLLHDGDLRIENNHRDGHYLEYYDAALKPDFMRRGTDRAIYSVHAPGVSVLVLPAFALGGYPAAVLVVVFVGALGIAALWRIAFLLTQSSDAAWMAAGAVATSVPWALHAFTIYPDPIGGALALAGVGALVVLDAGGRRVSAASWIGVGAALAILPWLHTRFALVAGVLAAAIVMRLWWRDDGRSDAVRFLSVPVVSAIAWFGYFWVIYGTPNPAAPYGSRPEGGLTFIPTGLAGLLVDQQFGLLATAPVLVVAVVGLAVLARQRPRLAAEILAVVAVYLATAASYPMWWGGYSAPARFAVVLVPMLGLPLAVVWVRSSAAIRGGIVALAAISAAVTAAMVGVDRGAFIYNGRDGYALLLDWLSRSADLTLAMPSVHRDGMVAALDDAAVWLVTSVWGIAVAMLAVRTVPRAGAVAGALVVPVVVMLASTVVWTGLGRAAPTPSTSQMSWLARWSPEEQPHVWQLTPTRALSLDDAPRRLNIATSIRGPRGAADAPLLRIPELPAGEYDLVIEPPGPLAGELTVRLGRQDVPIERWQLDGRPAGFSGLVLRLPVDAHSIAVSGDGAARASVRRMTVRPRVLVGRHQAAWARSAARYGWVVAYALDDNAYLEPAAIWLRGERVASFVVQTDDDRSAVLRLTGGPVPNEIRLSAGAWTRTVSLAAHAAADVTLPDDALAPATLAIGSRSGFRPADHDGSGDRRRLGVFVTWPDMPVPPSGPAVP